MIITLTAILPSILTAKLRPPWKIHSTTPSLSRRPRIQHFSVMTCPQALFFTMSMLKLSSVMPLAFTRSSPTFLQFKGGILSREFRRYVVSSLSTDLKLSDNPKKSWYHLQQTKIGDTFAIVCLCPHPSPPCVHHRFLNEYRLKKFPSSHIYNTCENLTP
jgi:hypothetical protein